MSKHADTLDLVLKATEFAAHKHRNQRRKDANASPYINHPIGLARVLRIDGGVDDPTVIAAALPLKRSVATLDADTRRQFDQVYEAILGLMATSARQH
jgi:(p)ppGpp synthase/HD superfamily hydrolase